MANTFNRLLVTGTSAGSTPITIGAGKTWVIIGLMASNVAGTLLTFSINIAGTSLAKNIPLPEGSSVSLLDGKIVMIAGDTLDEICSTDAGVEYIISYMEMT